MLPNYLLAILKNFHRFYELVVFLVAILAYWNTRSHGYVLDDGPTIEFNRFVQQGYQGLPDIFGSSYWRGFDAAEQGRAYRPLALATFALEREWFGPGPQPSHLVQVGLFGLLGALVVALVRGWASPVVALVAGLLFALHPIHTEVVANLKSRDELLALLLALLAWWLAHRGARAGGGWAWAWLGLAGGCYFAALLAKETPITFLVLFPLSLYFFARLGPRQVAIYCLPLAVAAGGYLWLRSAMLAGVPEQAAAFLNDPIQFAPTWGEQVGSRVAVVGAYLWLLVLPAKLTIARFANDVPVVGLFSLSSLATLLAVGGLGYYGFRHFRQKSLTVFGILFFFIALSLFPNLIINIGNSMAERFLFAPSLGFCLAVAGLLAPLLTARPGPGRNFGLALLGVALFFYGAKTVSRNRAWASNEVLVDTDLKGSPESAFLNKLKGNQLVKQFEQSGQAEWLNQALRHLNLAAQYLPNEANTLASLGYVYSNLNQPRNAIGYYERALAQAPGDALTRLRLSAEYRLAGDLQRAYDLLQGTKTDLYAKYVYLEYGELYLAAKSYTKAIQALEQGAKLPGLSGQDLAMYYQKLAEAYRAVGLADKAAAYESALRR